MLRAFVPELALDERTAGNAFTPPDGACGGGGGGGNDSSSKTLARVMWLHYISAIFWF